MPLYEYQCDACGTRFELIRKFSDPPLEVCPTCGRGPVTKQVSSPAFQFKGSGWYVTDYARKSGGDPSPPETKSDKAKSDKAETGGPNPPASAASSSSPESTSKESTESSGKEKTSKPSAAAGSTKDT